MSWIMDAVQMVFDINQRLSGVEEKINEFAWNTLQAVQSQLKKNWILDQQSEALYGARLALCVDTKDPWAQGRVRFYHPGIVNKDSPVEALPWAWPISVLGGFDDSGALWVPPAGSAIVLLFENGSRQVPFYLGTVWNRNRGEPPHNWNYAVPEYECIHQGHRKGYFTGKNDESQVLPPQNTYNYNIKDYDDLKAFEEDTEILKKVTPSHLYEIKTPQKHHLVFDDGNYYCNHRWKHLKIGSSCGHTFLMWDDHMHKAGQHAHPLACECGPNAAGGKGSGLACGEKPCDKDPPGECGDSEGGQANRCKNDLFKHESEARPWRGPCTPQNNKCELEQTGVFLSSISGHIFVQDDEVSDPEGVPDWERGTTPFSFGCENKSRGKMFWKTATGHMIKMGDAEDLPNVRSGDFIHPETGEYEPNGMLFKTATGHSIEMNDHTLPSGKAGAFRHIRIESTSKHLLAMVDETNDQKSPARSAGGAPNNKATKAYVVLRTGYGLQLLMRDDNSQDDESEHQFIELMAPQKKNDHKPHIFGMYESPPDDPGLVFLRAGGFFVGMSVREWIEVVGGDGPESPSSKITKVTEHDIHDTDKYYIYLSDFEFHHAEQYIVLAAGRDCPPAKPGGENLPCLHAVIVSKSPWQCPFTGFIHWGVESMSKRVFST